MEIKYLDINHFLKDFYPLIVELLCGKHYDANNDQHVQWVSQRVKAFYAFGGKAACLYKNDGSPAGFLFFLFDPGLEGVSCFGKRANIVMLGLYPEFRSKGFGKKLLHETESLLKDKNCECLYVDTYAANNDAIKYYIKEGFTPVAYHPGENGLDDKGTVYLYKELID